MQFEVETLPHFIATQRWYAAKGVPIKRAVINDWVLWGDGQHSWLIVLLQVETTVGQSSYFLPMALAWGDSEEEQIRALAPATLARVRQQSQVGVLADAFADEAFCRALVGAIGIGTKTACSHGGLCFTPTNAYNDLAGDGIAQLPLVRSKLQSSNTVVTLGDRLFLKGYRQLSPGINPEFEVGRFLTEVAQFTNCVPVAGAIEYVAADGTRTSLALLQGCVENQGDGWTNTLGYLERYFESRLTSTVESPADVHGAYLSLVHTLGTRTGELHKALALRTGNPAFDPEPLELGDIKEWRQRVQDDAFATVALLKRNLLSLSTQVQSCAQLLLDQQQLLLTRIEACSQPVGSGLKTRYHGDYHLGQVMLSSNDFIIIDFEGEPARPMAERRAKHSSLRDVAGMLRSFDYARWSALLCGTYNDDDRIILVPLAQAWLRETRETFLRAYDESTRDSGLYGTFAEVQGLIELFELEKALYEIRYEINNRPGWINIPLQGVLALCGLQHDTGIDKLMHSQGD